jgi:unsaturated chondroitin disaccharide hydrolase
MLRIDYSLKPENLASKIQNLWAVSAHKILSIERMRAENSGAPVYTVKGRYTSRGWTEWTQGFQYGSAILQFDATGEKEFLEIGRSNTLARMAPHVTHAGVHDHGFNNVSTYGNLLRLMGEGKIEENSWERAFYEMALKCSSSVQARRWTRTADGRGFIYSFNGPHSLFVDTLRTLRVLALGFRLGHVLFEENDRRICLLERLVHHARTTADYSVFYGEGRDAYDLRGRVAHECIFNLNDGRYRCPNSQQGYSPFSTWTRGLAWAICGFAELLEFLDCVTDEDLAWCGGLQEVFGFMSRAALAAADFYLENSAADGIPYWDTGAPGLADGDLDRPSDPFNDREPVDSSAAAIAAQGLMRLGRHLQCKGETDSGNRFWLAGLTVMNTLLNEPYLDSSAEHQGLVLHAVYHRPNGWDHIPEGSRIPCGESCMWGDYHMREAALYLQRIIENGPYLVFYGPGADAK